MKNKELEKELKELMKETLGYIDKRIAMVEKSVLKYADEQLDK